MSAPLIKNILLLDAEGKRVAVKYYNDEWPTLAAKMTYEKTLFAKTSRVNARTEGEMGSEGQGQQERLSLSGCL